MTGSINSGVRDTGGDSGSHNTYNDPLNLSNSDNPGAQLITLQFSSTNFLSWSRGIRLTLGVNNKLGFIDGSLVKPVPGSIEFSRWERANYMVRCWLLNSMASNFSEGFMYVESSRHLWEELSERYGQTNAPLVFQLKRELSSIVQNNMFVAEYFSKLKRVWDELQFVEGFPICSCGAMANCSCELVKKVVDAEARNRLMQLLMGLGETFENVRNNVLSMDPLPTVNKAYYLVQQVERQKEITGSNGSQNLVENSALAASRQNDRRDYRKDKRDQVCTHCRMKGHLVESCFKLHGFPKWYKGLRDGKNSAHANNAPGSFEENQSDTPLDLEKDQSANIKMDQNFVNAICQEVLKAMQGKAQANCSASTNMAGSWN